MTTRVRSIHLFDRIVAGYRKMAQTVRYRPAAPSDGCGTIMLDDEELRDPEILEDEAASYATAFCEADEAMLCEVHGCVDNRVAVVKMLALEAATLCNGGSDAFPVVRRLLELALAELKPTSYTTGRPRRQPRERHV